MADLFEQVLHHLEGEENEIQNWKSETGERAYSVPSFGPDRWIERAALGRFMAIDVLAVILFCVRDTFDIEKESRIVDGWAAELRKAASDGEIQARDPLTLLALGTLLTDWEWLISISDADKFVVARGMSWKCSEQVEYLLEQARQSGTRYLDPKSGRLLKHYWLAGYEPQPAPAHSTQHTAHSTTAPQRPRPLCKRQRQKNSDKTAALMLAKSADWLCQKAT